MAFFLRDQQGRPVGPYTREDLALFVERGLLPWDARVEQEGLEGDFSLVEVLRSGAVRTGTVGGERRATLPVEEPTAGGDFLRLAPHLMLPLQDLVRLRWLDNRRILGLAFVGLLPLVLLFYLDRTQDIGGAFWGIALYTSLLWAMFFYVAFSQPEVRVMRCLLTFSGAAIFSIGLVSLARYVVPFEWVMVWIKAPSVVVRWGGHLVGVAFIEELAKLFPLYFLWPHRARPQVMMFYGLMAGLGFGIYEGVAYQTSQNLKVSFRGNQPSVEGAAVYYLLNILRLTSLPFLHAMWTGIAGYFIGFAAQFPRRQGGLLMAALVVPAVLHATYNTFSDSPLGLAVALITVLALNVYLVKGRDFVRALVTPPSDPGL